MGRGALLWLLALLFACAVNAAHAEGAAAGVLALPQGTRAVADYAFANCEQITKVILPDGVERIGAYAFDGCTGVGSVLIPDSVSEIGDRAFPPGTLIECADGSYAADWAMENGYERQRRFYALLIGQEYTGSSYYLPGCFLDVDSMAAMLSMMDATPYRVTVCKDLTASGILSAVDAAFAGATSADVCLFYYAGHGLYSASSTALGSLTGTDIRYVSISQLKSALDRTLSTKVVVLDSCYSGAAISRSTVTQESLEAVNAAIISAFAPAARSAMAKAGYYVLTAAAKDENCYSGIGTTSTGKAYYGVFTNALLYGSGYNELAGSAMASMAADTNSDGMISLNEGYIYTYARALANNGNQHAQCYPTGSAFPLWGR